MTFTRNANKSITGDAATNAVEAITTFRALSALCDCLFDVRAREASLAPVSEYLGIGRTISTEFTFDLSTMVERDKYCRETGDRADEGH